MFLPTPILCIYLLAVPSLGCCAGFSLGVPSGGHSLVAVRGLLTAVASLVAEQTSKVVPGSGMSEQQAVQSVLQLHLPAKNTQTADRDTTADATHKYQN